MTTQFPVTGMPLVSLIGLLQWGTNTFDWFSGMFSATFIFMIVFSIVFAAVIVAIIVYVICRASSASRQVPTTYGVAPVPATPVREVVREALPTKCPACLAPISYEQVDWVGPRQAKCPYCGNIVELQETTEIR